jgi:hypothetical protein
MEVFVNQHPSSRFATAFLFAAGLSALGACGATTPTGPTATISPAGNEQLTAAVRAELAQVRAATAAFHDIGAANAAGYTVWSPDPFAPGAVCPTNPAGSMGYHLVNPALRGGAANPAAGDATVDPLRPEMLLYERRPDGKMHLVGVEYLVFKAAWERVNGAGAAPPVVLGQPLPFSSHSFVPGGANIDHYELHVWVWSNNPLGMFAPWNPTVTC